jgi:hypothetical protein
MNFEFLILDFGLKSGEHAYEIFCFEGFFRESEIHNPKAAPRIKMGGDLCYRSHIRLRGGAAGAQPAKKAPQMIGFPQGGATPASLVDAFRQGLRELGYVEG